MTLVYAAAADDVAYLVADTLLSAPFELKAHKGPVNGKFHGLKVQILNPQTAVAFATSNAAETCLCLTRELHAKLAGNSTTSVCDELFRSYKRAIEEAEGESPDCEFLVLQLMAHGNQLAKVTKNKISYCTRAYIGDAFEYKHMMGLRRPYSGPKTTHVQQPDGSYQEVPFIRSDGEIEFAEISNAMRELVLKRSDSVGAIGGCIVRISKDRVSGNLEYLQEAELGSSPWEGRFGFSMLSSNSGVYGIAIYYRIGKFGFLFIVGDDEFCRKEYAETLNGFIERARLKYGLDLVGVTWSD